MTLTSDATAHGVTDISVADDGKRVMATTIDGPSLLIWNAAPEAGESTAFPATNDLSTVRFMPDGRIVAGDVDEVLRSWSSDGTHVGPPLGSVDDQRFFEVSPDGAAVAVSGTDEGQPLEVIDTATGRTLYEVEGDLPSWSPDGRWLAVTDYWDGSVSVLDLEGNLVATGLRERSGQAAFAAFIPGSELLAVATTSEAHPHVTVWDWRATTRVRSIPADASEGFDVSADGSLFAASDGERVTLWRADGTGTGLLVQAEKAGPVRFSPDASLLAIANGNGSVRLYDVASLRLLRILDGHDFWIAGLDFSQDGRWLASHGAGRPSGGPGSVKVWAVNVDDLVAIAQERLTRSLTDEECRTYLRTETCADE